MKHVLPPLPYDFSALEPHIDTRTMMLHHDKHHASYVTKLNSAIESASALEVKALEDKSAIWLLLNLNKVPDKIRAAVHHNAGGHVNHSLLWRAMSPTGGGTPTGSLHNAIKDSFNSFENFKTQFEEMGNNHFASGWVWLVNAPNNKLQIMTTSGHDNPLMQGYFPLLLNDVWEHAYYLHYQNERMKYLKAWWSVVNWQEASLRFEHSQMPQESITENEFLETI